MAIKIKGQEQPEVMKAKSPRRETVAGSAKIGPVPPKTNRYSLVSYYRLVEKFPLVPIRDDAHLDLALAVAEDLLNRDLDEGAESYLEVLTGLIELYESKAYPIPGVSEADVLRELMRQNGLSQSTLEAKIGIAQPTISAVLRGVRGLTKEQIVTLARFFRVSPEVFLPKP